jgi:peptidoglycan hydrolase-like amidase
MADRGHPYWEILKFYYPLAEIRQLTGLTGQ